MAIREPFYGGVVYSDSESELEVLGYYNPDQFEDQCSDWWIKDYYLGQSYQVSKEEAMTVLASL